MTSNPTRAARSLADAGPLFCASRLKYRNSRLLALSARRLPGLYSPEVPFFTFFTPKLYSSNGYIDFLRNFLVGETVFEVNKELNFSFLMHFLTGSVSIGRARREL